MTADDLLASAVSRLSAAHLARYVAAYEKAPEYLLQNDCGMCAVGSMIDRGSREENTAFSEDYLYPLMAIGREIRRAAMPPACEEDTAPSNTCPPLSVSPLLLIEIVFEGWGGIQCPDPRRAIYEACIAEQAARGSVAVQQAETVSV